MAYHCSVQSCSRGQKREISGTSELSHKWNGRTLKGVSLINGYNGIAAGIECKERLLHEILDAKRDHSKDFLKTGFKNMQDRMKLITSKCWPKDDGYFCSLSGCSATVILFDEEKIAIGDIGDNVVYQFIIDGNEVRREVISKWHHLNDKMERDRMKIKSKSYGQRSTNSKVQLKIEGNFKRAVYLENELERVDVTSLTRGLGNFWSAVNETDHQIVSPIPDIKVLPLDLTKESYLVIVNRNLVKFLKLKEIAKYLSLRERTKTNIAEWIVNAGLERVKGQDFGSLSAVVIAINEFVNAEPTNSLEPG